MDQYPRQSDLQRGRQEAPDRQLNISPGAIWWGNASVEERQRFIKRPQRFP